MLRHYAAKHNEQRRCSKCVLKSQIHMILTKISKTQRKTRQHKGNSQSENKKEALNNASSKEIVGIIANQQVYFITALTKITLRICMFKMRRFVTY